MPGIEEVEFQRVEKQVGKREQEGSARRRMGEQAIEGVLGGSPAAWQKRIDTNLR